MNREAKVSPPTAIPQGARNPIAELPPALTAMVVAGTAHAILPALVIDHTAAIDIVAANGELCGTVVLPSVAHTRDVNIGRDGTVIVGGMPASYDTRFGDECEWRWWPGLFR